MATEENIIVAIELGSSKITGAAGKKLADGSIQVLAWAQEEDISFIHRGVVYYIDKTVQSLKTIIAKLKSQLKKDIRSVYVGFCGQGVRTIRNTIIRDLDNDTILSQELIDEIERENSETIINDRKIFDVIPQEYIVGTQKTTEPVGILTNRIEGHFLNLINRISVLTNMSNCFKEAGINVFDYKCFQQALADSVLSEVDKRSGCALIDLGKDTTTVSVYKGNLLRYLTVIPLGMGNITTDLTSLQIEEREAEELKLKYGSAYTEISEEDDESTKYTLHDGRQIEKEKFCDIVEARIEEIIQNVILQIEKSGYGRDTLLAGLVLTGGGSNMKDIEKAFLNTSSFDKTRIAKTVTFHVSSSLPTVNKKDGRENAILALLAQCKENCCGEKIGDPTLFGINKQKNVAAAEPLKPENDIDKLALLKKEIDTIKKKIDDCKGEIEQLKTDLEYVEENSKNPKEDSNEVREKAKQIQKHMEEILAEANKIKGIRKEDLERFGKDIEALNNQCSQTIKNAKNVGRKSTLNKVKNFLSGLVSPTED